MMALELFKLVDSFNSCKIVPSHTSQIIKLPKSSPTANFSLISLLKSALLNFVFAHLSFVMAPFRFSKV